MTVEKLFPKMHSCPKKGTCLAIVCYWLPAFILVPQWLPYFSLGMWEDPAYGSWLQIGYHALNAVVMLVLLREYLRDEWFMVTTAPGHYMGVGGIAAGLMTAVTAATVWFRMALGEEAYYVLGGLPVTEMLLTQTPRYLVRSNPVFGIACMTLLSPACLCGMFYALGFAPVCRKRTWLAYLAVAGVTLIPSILDIIWRGDTPDGILFVLDIYILRLPVHLIACWAYQKTDNLFTPMLALGILNLLGGVANLYI